MCWEHSDWKDFQRCLGEVSSGLQIPCQAHRSVSENKCYSGFSLICRSEWITFPWGFLCQWDEFLARLQYPLSASTVLSVNDNCFLYHQCLEGLLQILLSLYDFQTFHIKGWTLAYFCVLVWCRSSNSQLAIPKHLIRKTSYSGTTGFRQKTVAIQTENLSYHQK